LPLKEKVTTFYELMSHHVTFTFGSAGAKLVVYNGSKAVSVCLCVNKSVPNHNCYAYRLVILHGDSEIHPGKFPRTFPQTLIRRKKIRKD